MLCTLFRWANIIYKTSWKNTIRLSGVYLKNHAFTIRSLYNFNLYILAWNHFLYARAISKWIQKNIYLWSILHYIDDWYSRLLLYYIRMNKLLRLALFTKRLLYLLSLLYLSNWFNYILIHLLRLLSFHEILVIIAKPYI